MIVLGLHSGVTINQHDPGCALIRDGQVVAACEEERFIRVKGPRGFLPINSIAACLEEAGISMRDVDLVVHTGETYEDMPGRIGQYLTHYFGHAPSIRMINHQMGHLAGGFYGSGFSEAMCLSYDAWGDRISAALGIGDGEGVRMLETRQGENSLGLFYATMTSYLGFLPNEDEYKVMGLAPYGRDGAVDLSAYAHPADDGYVVDAASLGREQLPVRSRFEPFYSQTLVDRLGPSRQKNEPIDQRHKDIARATQVALEACAVSLVTYLHRLTGQENLVLSGGVALNCSANRLLVELPFIRRLYIQPSASDRGLALGCALEGAAYLGEPVTGGVPHQFLGPSSSAAEDTIRHALEATGTPYVRLEDPSRAAAGLIAEGKIIGWFQGRSEFGPRALGNRSILADPRDGAMKDAVNMRIKFREGFRPFAPAILEEKAADVFEMEGASPFMTVVYKVRPEWQARLGATTHIDGTARVQTVSAQHAHRFHALIQEFDRLTGVPAVLNTSFNVMGEPIVETPLDALRAFGGTGLDALIMGNFLIEKPLRR